MTHIEAIVIGTSPYGESTLIIRLLTREMGVVRAMVKGALRTRGRNPASFDCLARIKARLRLKNPDALGVIVDIQPLDNWPWLHADVTGYAYAATGVEIIGSVAATTSHDSFCYEECCRFLHGLEHAAGPGSFMIIMLIRLLHYCGFAPRVPDHWSMKSMPASLEYRFDTQSFSDGTVPRSGHDMNLTGRALAPLLPVIRNPPELSHPFQVNETEGILLLQWLVRVWEDHLNTRFKSVKFLRKMIWNKSPRKDNPVPNHA